jgi:hypothetical protein
MKDADLMALADGELDEREMRDLEDRLDAASRQKIDALGELGELVRGHLELSADTVPAKKFEALWREIDKGIDREKAPEKPVEAKAAPAGFLRRVGRWFDQYRGHIITGMASAGAVAALALILRSPATEQGGVKGKAPVEQMPIVHRPAEIESLDTPGGTSTVFNLEDEDGDTTVIWVTPQDTVEGI